MARYANQKDIIINKPNEDKFSYYGVESMRKATKELTLNELRVYIYLLANKDGYNLELSTKDISEKQGGKQSSIQEAVNKLIEKGYLVCVGGNKYIFNAKGKTNPHFGKN